jgi:hypothetical protein
MAATDEALVKFAAGTMKPGGMRSLAGRRSSGGPKEHPLSHARTMTGKRSQMSSALAQVITPVGARPTGADFFEVAARQAAA